MILPSYVRTQSLNILNWRGQVSVYAGKSMHKALWEPERRWATSGISKLFQVKQKNSNSPIYSVCSAGNAQKAIYIKHKKNMPCAVYKNICNKLRTKPETVQAGLTGQGQGEKRIGSKQGGMQ